MDLDDVYIQIGEFGFQQKIYIASLCMFNLYSPFHAVQSVFTAQAPSFTCISNGAVFNNSCRNNQLSSCDSIVYQDYPDSVGKQWNLICDEAYKVKFIQSAYMAGVGVGALTLGSACDKYGRLRTMALTLFGMIVFGMTSSFMQQFGFYLFMRSLTGVCAAGNIVSSFVLASELVGPSKRGQCGNIYQVFFALGISLCAALAYFIKNWRALSTFATLVGVPFMLLFIYLPESPRWLITHYRSREARQVLRLIADKNGRSFPSDMEIVVPIPSTNRGTLLDMFKHRKTLVSTLIQMFSWFCNSAVYYGLTLASDGLGSNIYTSTMLSGVVELPACVLIALLIDRVGRRCPLSMFMLVGGLSCLLIQFIQIPDVTFALALVGKLSISGSFAIIYIHSAELFPTTHRSSGLGLCSLFARFGGIISPFVGLVDSIQPFLQFTIFGVLSLSAGILNLFLDETVNRTLPETLDDLMNPENIDSEERGKYTRLAGSNENLADSEKNHTWQADARRFART